MSMELVNDRTDELRTLYRSHAVRFVGNAAEVARNVARGNAPVDTGFLRANIVSKVRKLGRELFEAVVTAYVNYAIFQEYGTGIYAENGKGRQTPWTYFSEGLGRFVTTVGNRPHPFMRPGFEAGRAWVMANAHRFHRG